VVRTCARPTCATAASATLSYDYRSGVVWIDVLHLEPHPANHDLCERHATGLSVPNGWRLEDLRVSSAAPAH
jgi:hypothetical protein